jgi:hypothetical protein
MTKIELIAKVLLAEFKGPEQTNETLTELISSSLKEFACDLLNQLSALNESKLDAKIIKQVMEQNGISLDLRTGKFS